MGRPHLWTANRLLLRTLNFGLTLNRDLEVRCYDGGLDLKEAAVSDKPPPVKSATDARQGRTTGVVRWVLGISLAAAIIAMIIAYLVS